MKPRSLFRALFVLLAFSLSAHAQEFEARIFTNAAGATIPYRLLKPDNYDAAKKYPMVVFFHGAGERGTDNAAQLKNGVKLFLTPRARAEFPCFVLAPQCPPNQQWVDMPWGADSGTQPEQPSKSMQLVIELLHGLPGEFSVDPDRLYVTGLSMGGYATWDFATRFPKQVAAAAPVCGGGDEKVAARAAQVPIWAFHSDDDTTVKTIRTRNMIAAVKAAGGKPKYFEYSGLGHNSWDKTYSEPELLPWMFAQRAGQPDTFELKTAPPAIPAIGLIPETNDGLPGAGTIRRFDWFKSLWRQKRIAWSKRVEQDQGAVVFLGDSITQGWGDTMRNSFPGVKVANRGISGDTSRGVLYRLKEDVLDLHPSAVALLIGTNDLEENDDPSVTAENLKLILAKFKEANPRKPIVLCEVFPSSESKKRPAARIKQINALYAAAVKGDARVTLLETWPLFADARGDAKIEEFPDLLHPNNTGYAKWAAGLRPILATLGLLETEPDTFVPEPGFVSLFNGRDLTGWGFRATPESDIQSAKRWKASDPNAPLWPIVEKAVSFDGLTSSPDGRYVARSGRLIVTTPPEGRRIQQLSTTKDFPKNFVLKLEFRATPNADSGVFIRQPQLQCRDYLLAGPYKQLQKYKPQDWNEMIVTVRDGVANCTCNGETLEAALKVPATGPIGLEGDRGQMEYRRIRMQELP